MGIFDKYFRSLWQGVLLIPGKWIGVQWTFTGSMTPLTGFTENI